jgi:hypothetical protein
VLDALPGSKKCTSYPRSAMRRDIMAPMLPTPSMPTFKQVNNHKSELIGQPRNLPFSLGCLPSCLPWLKYLTIVVSEVPGVESYVQNWNPETNKNKWFSSELTTPRTSLIKVHLSVQYSFVHYDINDVGESLTSDSVSNQLCCMILVRAWWVGFHWAEPRRLACWLLFCILFKPHIVCHVLPWVWSDKRFQGYELAI